MFSTYKLMAQVLVPNNKKFTNEELAVKYQETHNPTVLAEVFCRNFPQWLHLAQKPLFFRIDNDEKASIVLERLNRALETFDTTKNYKFTTYANKLISMELISRNNVFNYKNRSIVKCVSLSDTCLKEDVEDIRHHNEVFSNFVKNTQYEEQEYNLVDLKQSIERSNFSDKEKLICNIILDNPGISDKEISELMKVHRHTVERLKIKLQTKLQCICTY